MSANILERAKGTLKTIERAQKRKDGFGSTFALTFLATGLSELFFHSVQTKDFFHGKTKEVPEFDHWYGRLSFYVCIKSRISGSLGQFLGIEAVKKGQPIFDDKLFNATCRMADLAEEALFDNFPDGSVPRFFASLRAYMNMFRHWSTPRGVSLPFQLAYASVRTCLRTLDHRLSTFEYGLKASYEKGDEDVFLTNSLFDTRRSLEENESASDMRLLKSDPPDNSMARDIWFTVVHADAYYGSLRRELKLVGAFFEGKDVGSFNQLSCRLNPQGSFLGGCYEAIKEILDKSKGVKDQQLLRALQTFTEDVMDYLDGVKRVVWGKDKKDPLVLTGLREILLRFAECAESIVMGGKPDDEGWDYLLQSAFRQFTRFSEAVGRIEKKIIVLSAGEEKGLAGLIREVAEKGDSILSILGRIDKRSQKKNEKHNLKIGSTNLKWLAKRWIYEKNHPELYPDVKGRQVSKADVFGRIPKLLSQHGVKSYRDLVNAIANARKQHPEWFPKEKRRSGKKASRG